STQACHDALRLANDLSLLGSTFLAGDPIPGTGGQAQVRREHARTFPGDSPRGQRKPVKGAGVLTDHAAIERFQALYAEHHARVYAYAVSRVGRQLADEVVSEVFLVVWRRLADVPAPALPWLLTVARNTACNQFRGSARQRSIGAELRAWVSEAELSEPDVAEAVAERICVLTALATLPEADPGLLTLVAWHGLKPNGGAQREGGGGGGGCRPPPLRRGAPRGGGPRGAGRARPAERGGKEPAGPRRGGPAGTCGNGTAGTRRGRPAGTRRGRPAGTRRG